MLQIRFEVSRNYKKVRVDSTQIREAVEKYITRYNLTYTEVAKAAGMSGPKLLKECLGIIERSKGGYQTTLRISTAARIIRAIDRAPFEFDI